MSSFNTLEISRESSRPLEIYEIVQGTDVHRFTSAEDDLIVGGDTYEAAAIARNNIEQGSDSQARSLIVTLPGDNVFATRYKNVVPGVRATMNVWRLQRGEVPTFNTRILLFKGQVLSVRYPQDGYASELVCRSIENALNRNMPRFSFGGMCNHILYDSRCGVNSALFDVVGTVSAVSGATITLPGANLQPDQFYRGGFCQLITGEPDYRMILSHVGNVLTLLLPFHINVSGVQVQAFAGCNHLVTGDCATKFDNVAQFGGFGWVPNKNIFETGLD